MSSWYFHGALSRTETEDLLKKAAKDGAFLVRNSASMPSSYSLCLLFEEKVHQYRIMRDREGNLFIQAEKGVEERKFATLDLLIEDYLVRGNQNGLITGLKFAVACEKGDNWYELEQSVYNDDALTSHFKLQLQRLDLSLFDGDLVSQLRRFVDCRLLHDAVRCKEGGRDGLLFFRDMLKDSTTSLMKEVRYFEQLMDLLTELFCGTKVSPNSKKSLDGADIFQVLDHVANIRQRYVHLEERVADTLTSFLMPQGADEFSDSAACYCSTEKISNSTFNLSMDSCSNRSSRQTHVTKPLFEVKVTSKKLSQKELILTVDTNQGKLFQIKPSQLHLDESAFIPHDKIDRVVKSTVNKCLLHLKILDRRKEGYLFRDFRERELFCQLVTHMRRLHSKSLDPDTLSVFVGTWNMAGEWPRWSLLPWLKSIGSGRSRDPALASIPQDLYVIGTQDSADSERKWEEHVKRELELAFGLEYHTVSVVSLWGIRLLILVRPEYRSKITDLHTCTVRCSLKSALGARGAVAVSFKFNATSLAFVTCHLPTWPSRQAKRDVIFKEILKGLNLGERTLPGCDLTHQFDHVFWFGDLSCRLEGSMNSIESKLQLRSFTSLLNKDQLRLAQRNKDCFHQFSEEEILFPPTYRYEKNKRDQWATCVPRVHVAAPAMRINIPSWCDRVLKLSRPDTYCQVTSYGLQMDQDVSDHKPVFASFQLACVSEYAPMNPLQAVKSRHSDGLRFEFITVKLRNCSAKHSFQLCFYGNSIGGRVDSAANTHFLPPDDLHRTGVWRAPPETYICPVWQNVIPPLELSTEDPAFLEDAHLIVMVRNMSTEECVGSCVISLKRLLSEDPQSIDTYLTFLGDERGCLLAHAHISSKSDSWKTSLARRRSMTRTYELVAFDTEFPVEDNEEVAAIPEENSSGSSSEGLVVTRDVAVAHSNSFKNDVYLYQEPVRKGLIDTPPPLPPKRRGRSQSSSQRQELEPVSGPTSLPPPDTIEYETLSRPATLAEWLTHLKLERYIEILESGGCKTLQAAQNLSDQALLEMGVTDTDHRSQIIKSFISTA